MSGKLEMSEAEQDLFGRFRYKHIPSENIFDVKAMLKATQDILNYEDDTSELPDESHEELDQITGELVRDSDLAYAINKVYSEIVCNRSGELALTVESISTMLAIHRWEAKVVIVLAAFAMAYGEFRLVVKRLESDDQLANSIAIIKRLHNDDKASEIAAALKRAFSSVKLKLVKVVQLIIALSELKTRGIDSVVPNIAPVDTDIIKAAFYATLTIMACAKQITKHTWFGFEFDETDQVLNLETLSQKLEAYTEQLDMHKETWNNKLADLEELENYEKIKTGISSKKGVIESLLQYLEQEKFELFKEPANAEDKEAPNEHSLFSLLKNQHILLLISDLDLDTEGNELCFLRRLFESNSKEVAAYDVIWLPVVSERSVEPDLEKFEEIRKKMKWYSVKKVATYGTGVGTYVEKVWKFKKKPLLISIKREVLHQNALPMLNVWGIEAKPFTKIREQQLWKDQGEKLKIDFLLGQYAIRGINMTTPIPDGSPYLVLCGGSNAEWYKEFLGKFKKLADAAEISHMIIHIGKTNHDEPTYKQLEKAAGNMQYTCTVYPSYSNREFWMRLESIRQSKWLSTENNKDDLLLKEIIQLNCFDTDSANGWTIIGRGLSSDNLVKAKGATALKLLEDFEQWQNLPGEDYVEKMKDHLKGSVTKSGHNCQLLISNISWDSPDEIYCPDPKCGQKMEKFTSYRCSKGPAATD